MALPGLDIDFVRTAAARSPVATLLLGIGALAALWVMAELADVRDEAARWESKLSDTKRMARRTLPSLAADDAPSRETALELKAANEVLDQLTLPWDALFADIEAAVTPDVALLAVQPDARNRVVVIAGEGRDLNAVLTFLARLDASAVLADTHLLSHEIKVDDRNRPMAFTIQARWTPAR